MKEKVIETAGQFIGITEQGGENAGFNDASFQSMLERTGWKRGYSWCALYVKLVMRLVCGDKHELDRLFSPSVMTTFHNFKGLHKDYISQTPTMGSLVVWRTGITTGHIGFVKEIGQNGEFWTIEGNSQDSVKICKRSTLKQRKNWYLLGFITIPDDYFK